MDGKKEICQPNLLFFSSFKTEKTGFGTIIKRLNGLERRSHLSWNIYKKAQSKKEQDGETYIRERKGIEKIFYKNGDDFLIKYEVV